MSYVVKYHPAGLLNTSLKTPESFYFFNNPEYIPSVHKDLANIINAGQGMLLLYEELRRDMHITAVFETLGKMEQVFHAFDYERYVIKKSRGDGDVS